MSGFQSATATALPGGSPRPDSRQVVPASYETSIGGRASTTTTTVEPASAAATTRGRFRRRSGRPARTARPRTTSPSSRSTANVPPSVAASDDHPDSASIAATTAVARRAAAAGANPADRAERYDDAERIAGPGRIAVDRERRHVIDPAVRVNGGAARAVGDEQLANAERERVAEHLGLLLAQLEHPDVAQHLRVEVGVELEQAGRAGPDEPLPVEREPSPASRGGERLGGEVGSRERRRRAPSARRPASAGTSSGSQVSPSARTVISRRSPS